MSFCLRNDILQYTCLIVTLGCLFSPCLLRGEGVLGWHPALSFLSAVSRHHAYLRGPEMCAIVDAIRVLLSFSFLFCFVYKYKQLQADRKCEKRKKHAFILARTCVYVVVTLFPFFVFPKLRLTLSEDNLHLLLHARYMFPPTPRAPPGLCPSNTQK